MKKFQLKFLLLCFCCLTFGTYTFAQQEAPTSTEENRKVIIKKYTNKDGEVIIKTFEGDENKSINIDEIENGEVIYNGNSADGNVEVIVKKMQDGQKQQYKIQIDRDGDGEEKQIMLFMDADDEEGTYELKIDNGEGKKCCKFV